MFCIDTEEISGYTSHTSINRSGFTALIGGATVRNKIILFVFTFSILFGSAVAITNPSYAHAEEPYPEVERRLDLSYRCVLYETELRSIAIMREWSAFRRMSTSMVRADMQAQTKGFEDFKDQLNQLIRKSPGSTDYAQISAELVRGANECDFRAIDGEVARITRELGDSSLEAADESERNDEELREAKSSAVDEKLEEVCGKPIR